jgi:2-keto-3-deoxy-L-rhamnonate aldolase RhmA
MDFQILDCEHGGYDFETLLRDIVACEARRCEAWVRVGGSSAVEVQRCLDLGASGIVFPQLSDLDSFRRAISMMDHPPRGIRGFNPFVRGYDFGAREECRRPRPVCIPIIETLQAVDALESVLALERVDMIYIGGYDLSAQVGQPGRMDHPDVVELIERVAENARRVGKPVAVMAIDVSSVIRWRARGVQCFVRGVDSDRIRTALSVED